MIKKRMTNGMSLLNDEQIRRAVVDGRNFYAAVDLVRELAETQHPLELWTDLKRLEPALVAQTQIVEFQDGPLDALDLEGVFRLIQSVPSQRAERWRQWLAATARERIEESEDPELAILRSQRTYQQQGYDKDWIAKRLQSIGGRHEITREWYRRGVRDSDEFRTLTNELVAGSFGMDVNTYRRYKGLWRAGQNLRDHMTDLELALVSLGETVAANLHRRRHSNGFQALNADAKDAGAIVAGTRAEIERQTGRPVVSATNHVAYRTRTRSQQPSQASQIETPKDVAA